MSLNSSEKTEKHLSKDRIGLSSSHPPGLFDFHCQINQLAYVTPDCQNARLSGPPRSLDAVKASARDNNIALM